MSVENGTHKFKAYYLDWESDEVSVTAQNRKNYELFYRKVGVFKMTGTWCTYCPAMTSALKKVEELMPGRMVIMDFILAVIIHITSVNAPCRSKIYLQQSCHPVLLIFFCS